MAKSLLQTAIRSSMSKTEEREKTKRAQLRKEAAEARDEAAEARRYARNTSAEAKWYDARAKQINAAEEARAAELQRFSEYKEKIDSYVFDANDTSKIAYQLSELQSEVQNGLSEEGINGKKFILAYNKFKLGVKLLKKVDPDNYMLEDFNVLLIEIGKLEQEKFKQEHYLSYRAKNSSIKYLLDDYYSGRESDASVLLDALVTIDKAMDDCTQIGTGSDFSILRSGYKKICKQAILLHPNDEDLKKFMDSHKHKLYRVQKILIIVLGIMLIFGLTMTILGVCGVLD